MSNHTDSTTETIFQNAAAATPEPTAPVITINLDPAHSITPRLLGQAVFDALRFGTDDNLALYRGVDALSLPLEVYGTTVGFINIK